MSFAFILASKMASELISGHLAYKTSSGSTYHQTPLPCTYVHKHAPWLHQQPCISWKFVLKTWLLVYSAIAGRLPMVHYSGTPLNGHPSTVDTHDIMDNSESCDCPSPLKSRHPTTPYNGQVLGYQLYPNSTSTPS